MSGRKRGERAVYEVTITRVLEMSATVEVEAHDDDEALALAKLEVDNPGTRWNEGALIDEYKPIIRKTDTAPSGRTVTIEGRRR